jgi:hypothetical protein
MDQSPIAKALRFKMHAAGGAWTMVHWSLAGALTDHRRASGTSRE